MSKDNELRRMQDLAEGFKTKADRMRVLAQHGYKTADIARFLEVRYQQVRNTLEGDKRTGYSPDLTPGSAATGKLKHFETLSVLRTIAIGEDGFGQVPPDLIDELTENDQQLLAIQTLDGVFLTNLAGIVARTQLTL